MKELLTSNNRGLFEINSIYYNINNSIKKNYTQTGVSYGWEKESNEHRFI